MKAIDNTIIHRISRAERICEKAGTPYAWVEGKLRIGDEAVYCVETGEMTMASGAPYRQIWRRQSPAQWAALNIMQDKLAECVVEWHKIGMHGPPPLTCNSADKMIEALDSLRPPRTECEAAQEYIDNVQNVVEEAIQVIDALRHAAPSLRDRVPR